MVSPIQALLRGPGVGNDRGWCALLPAPERAAHERPVAIMPSGFHEHTPQMGVAGFGDRAARLTRSTGVLRRHEADEGHRARRRAEPARIAEFGGDRQGSEIVYAAKTPQSTHPRSQRLKVDEGSQVLFHTAEAGDGFVNGAQTRGVRLLERRQRPRLRAEPGGVGASPGPLRPR